MGALDFNGGGERASLPTSAFESISAEVTVSMWVFGDTIQAQNDTVFRAIGAGNSRLLNVHLPWGDSKVYWEFGDTSGRDKLITNAQSETSFKGQWNLWTFTKDASGSMNAYLNGQFVRSANTGRNLPEVSSVILGSDGSSGGSYDGRIDDVRLYNYALDADETLALFNSYTNNQPPTAANVNMSVVEGRATPVTLAEVIRRTLLLFTPSRPLPRTEPSLVREET